MLLLRCRLFLLLAFVVPNATSGFDLGQSAGALRWRSRDHQQQLREVLRKVPQSSANARAMDDEREFSLLTSISATPYIIADYFTAADNTALVGRLATTDLPGFGYADNGNVSQVGGPTGGTPYEADIQSNAARVGADGGFAIDLNNSAPLSMQLSIKFNISADSQTQADNAHRGAGLGFFSSVNLASGGSSHGFNNFTGLAVDRNGSVRLIIGGTDSGIFTSSSSFDPNATHTLTYDINITPGVGTISNILLDSTSIALIAPTNTFTAARTVYAGFYNSSGSGTDLATFDNFLLAQIPEPSTPASFAFGLLILSLMRRLVGRARNSDDA